MLGMGALAALMAVGGSPRVSRRIGTLGSTSSRIGIPESKLLQTPNPYQGILVDAGCPNRSTFSLMLPPESLSAAINGADNSGNATSGNSAFGITVSPQTLEGERSDIMPHQVPDMRTRQTDPTCAVTANTRALALLLASGRLVNLDSGGNTFAWQSIQSTPEGRAMLNGAGPGVKPFVTVTGYILQNTLIVVNPIVIPETNSSQAGGSATRVNPAGSIKR